MVEGGVEGASAWTWHSRVDNDRKRESQGRGFFPAQQRLDPATSGVRKFHTTDDDEDDSFRVVRMLTLGIFRPPCKKLLTAFELDVFCGIRF